MRSAIVTTAIGATLVGVLAYTKDLDHGGQPPPRPSPRLAIHAGGATPPPLPYVAPPPPGVLPSGPRPQRGRWLSLVYGGNGQGEIEPCG